ncbi:MAG: 16S rRNA (adenine(1518)-N(6)/adenine(1519)-N(6))-dimethyltransferase RsmA [Endomicrobium sp.]|jgi:16S rRNA (adenine1518-N6/adenine1519-N6)-dimethyltransferase|nr:16S rRNA (adenine(1518)-N(6)/adenine(1519)-N(6))-dimethyltransferase RsmA [Endomicrobium sp.]
MRQKHGQNFLIDNNIAINIIKAANLDSKDNVLEIGPGNGILTKLIHTKVNNLTTIEIDGTLFQQLRHYFSFHNITNVELINEDFLKYDIDDIERKFISNLPYNVGTAIIQRILPLQNWTTAVFMLQKEVIARLAAKHGSKDYGYISIFTSYYADAEILFDVSPKCFNPPPKVVSSVIKLKNKKSEYPDDVFFDFVKHAFSMRRKTILNSLSSFCNIPKNDASKIIETCGLNVLLRPDKLSVFAFLSLTKEIKKYRICRAEI